MYFETNISQPPCFERHVKPLASTNPHWALVVGCGVFSLFVIHKEGVCPCSGDIIRLMMMMVISQPQAKLILIKQLIMSFDDLISLMTETFVF
jgi:hypothetical protein